MKAKIVALAVALVPGLAFGAAATWTAAGAPAVCSLNGTYSATNCRSTAAACASGTCDAPTLATQGTDLTGVATFDVIVCATTGAATITGGSSIVLYYYDAATAAWAKGPSGTANTGGRCSYVVFDSPGKGVPVLSPRGRVAAIPSGITLSADGATVYVLAVGDKGQGL